MDTRHLSEMVNAAGLQGYVNSIAALLRPSILLQTAQSAGGQDAAGHSKFGGVPNLAQGLVWPRQHDTPLSFIGQIRCDDIAPFDTASMLPQRGVLYFFYDYTEKASGYSFSDKDGWQVIYRDADCTDFAQVIPPTGSPIDLLFHTRLLDFKQDWTLPSPRSVEVENLGLTREEEWSYFELLKRIAIHNGRTGPNSRMLGHADSEQADPRMFCEAIRIGLDYRELGRGNVYQKRIKPHLADWILLLQVSSETAASDSKDRCMFWGDAGTLYFWIHRDDLKRLDFSKVWLISESS